MGELVAAMREVVRAEATPEGWQAERQKLERKASLLEEQLRSSKIHQEQLREAMRAQHAQLAEAQMMAQQMREHQLRLDGDRQMRELEIEHLEEPWRPNCGKPRLRRNSYEWSSAACRSSLPYLWTISRGPKTLLRPPLAVLHL